jgi:GNAT superfamily N-acetyltransferase
MSWTKPDTFVRVWEDTDHFCRDYFFHHLRCLDRECFAGETVKDFTRAGDYWWLVYDAVIPNIPVAFAGIHIGRRGAVGVFLRAGVTKAARGRGLHRALIHYRLRLAKMKGCPYAWSMVATWNHWSANNHTALGMRIWYPTPKIVRKIGVDRAKRFVYFRKETR